MKYGKQLRTTAALSEVFETGAWLPYKKLKHMIKSECSDEEFLESLLEGISQVEKNFLKIQETKDEYNQSIIEDELNTYLDTNKTAIQKITKKYLKRRGTSFYEEVQSSLENTALDINNNEESTKNTKNTQNSSGSQLKSSPLNCAAKEFVPSSSPITSKLNANAKSFVFSADAPSFTLGSSEVSLSADAAVFIPKFDSPKASGIPVHEKDPCTDTFPSYSDFYMAVDSEFSVNWEELSHLVSPTFADEISPEDKCDADNRIYGSEFLKSVQGRHTDIHQDILHKPELLCEKTMQNVYFQLIHNLTASGMMPPMPINPLMAAPHMNPLGPMGIPPMGMMPPQLLFQMLSGGPEAMSMLAFPQNFNPPKNEESKVENNGKGKKKNKKSKSSTPSPRKRPDSPTRSTSKKEVLHKSKNAWSRRTVVTEEEVVAGRTMQSLLNKLVPEKFEKLVVQALKDITITTQKTLNEITARLHKKAISEAKYAPLYTHFVRKLKQSGFPSFEDEENEEVHMESILFDLCLERLDARFEPESEDLDDKCKSGIFWKQTLGNYTLLGELYKREIASHEKIVNVIVTLLGIIKNPAEDAIERGKRVEQLFHLLKSCGTDFEEKCRKNNHLNNISAREPTFLDQCFQDLLTTSKDESLQTRARFMLQDLIDLKNKHWEQRNDPSMCPKFLSEIKADIQKERIQKSRKLAELKYSNCNKRRKAQTPRPRSGPRRKLWAAPKSRSESNLFQKPAAKARSPKIDKIKWASLVQGLVTQDEIPESIVNAWDKGRPHIEESRSVSPDSSAVTEATISSAVTGRSRSGSIISREESESLAGQSDVEIDGNLFEEAVLELFDCHDLENLLLNLDGVCDLPLQNLDTTSTTFQKIELPTLSPIAITGVETIC